MAWQVGRWTYHGARQPLKTYRWKWCARLYVRFAKFCVLDRWMEEAGEAPGSEAPAEPSSAPSRGRNAR